MNAQELIRQSPGHGGSVWEVSGPAREHTAEGVSARVELNSGADGDGEDNGLHAHASMSSTYRLIAPISTQRDLYPSPITALAFDTASDTLWTGNSTGSVVAFHGTRGSRGVCFPVGGESAVRKVLVGDQYVRALGTAGLGVGQWSKGGVNNWYHKCVPHF